MQSGFTGDLVRVSPDVLFVQYFSRKTRDSTKSTKFAFHHDQLAASFSIPFVTRNICLLAPSHFTCVNPYVTSKPATHEKVVSGSAKEFTHRGQCGAVKRRRRMPRSVCDQSAGVGRGWMKRGSFVSFKPPALSLPKHCGCIQKGVTNNHPNAHTSSHPPGAEVGLLASWDGLVALKQSYSPGSSDAPLPSSH